MPPKSDRPDDPHALPAGLTRPAHAELTPPHSDIPLPLPAVSPAIRSDDPATVADHVLLTDWMAKPKKKVTRLISKIIAGLTSEDPAWTPERILTAIEAGLAAGCLEECGGTSGEPSITLTPYEISEKRRGLRPWLGRNGYEWAARSRKDRQEKKSFRVATKKRVILEADLTPDDIRVGGRAKIKGPPPRLSDLARISDVTHAYLEVLEDFERGSRATKGEQGQAILEAAMGGGAGFHGIGDAWPDKYLQPPHDGPGDPPSDPTRGEPCPNCGGDELGILIYCCRCDRSGADEWVSHKGPYWGPRRRGKDKQPRKPRGQSGEVTKISDKI